MKTHVKVFSAVAAVAILTGCGGPKVTYTPSGTYTPKIDYPMPPIPTAQQLDAQFHDVLDSDVSDEERLSLIEDGELFKDDLPSFNDQRSKNPNAVYSVADPVFDNGDGTVTATFKLDKSGSGQVVHSIPVHFIALDGKWKLSREDLCGILTSNDYTTKACS